MNPAFPYQLAAVDLDDTLLGADKRVSAANHEAIRALRERGVEVVLASGRAVASMVAHHHELGLTGPMISLNGAVVSRPATGELLKLHRIAAQTGARLIAEGLELGFTLVACCAHRTFASRRTPMLERYQSRGGEREVVVGFPADLDAEGLLKLIWIAPPADLDGVPASVLAGDGAGTLNVIRTESHHLEFMAADADKGTALRFVAERLGIPRERTIAVGDGPNDVGMLTWAGRGVAVGHAAGSVRAVADLVGPPAGDPATAFAGALAPLLATAGAAAA